MVTILQGTCSFFLPSWSSFNRPSAEINRNAQNVTKCPTPGSSWISSSRQTTAEQHPNNVVAISGNACAIFLLMKKKSSSLYQSLYNFHCFAFLNLTVLAEIAEMKLKDESQLVEITIKFKHHIYQLFLKY